MDKKLVFVDHSKKDKEDKEIKPESVEDVLPASVSLVVQDASMSSDRKITPNIVYSQGEIKK